MRYSKYHGLGNDYIVIRPEALQADLTVQAIIRICHRNYGIGSDGILLGPLESNSCDYGLKIFNPDGSEAEKSGNGLRIFARSLRDDGIATGDSFTVETVGGPVTCELIDGGRMVKVEMGSVSFGSADIPVSGADREVLNEEIVVDGESLQFCAATVGNPHCIVLSDAPSETDARRYGPLIETDAQFPERTNVQFMKVVDRNNIQIEIWERGAGYTLASGSSSTASAAVAHKLGLCDASISVRMPGGTLEIEFDEVFNATMTGPVTRVAAGDADPEMLD